MNFIAILISLVVCCSTNNNNNHIIITNLQIHVQKISHTSADPPMTDDELRCFVARQLAKQRWPRHKEKCKNEPSQFEIEEVLEGEADHVAKAVPFEEAARHQ
jgi:hypothetical protein